MTYHPPRTCPGCRRVFMPEAAEQRACSFRCARSLVSSSTTNDEDECVPHPKRQERINRGRFPRPLSDDEQTERARRIAEALADLRETNRRRRAS